MTEIEAEVERRDPVSDPLPSHPTELLPWWRDCGPKIDGLAWSRSGVTIRFVLGQRRLVLWRQRSEWRAQNWTLGTRVGCSVHVEDADHIVRLIKAMAT